jgi:hypothetical protein
MECEYIFLKPEYNAQEITLKVQYHNVLREMTECHWETIYGRKLKRNK